jgi:hypothetical protein
MKLIYLLFLLSGLSLAQVPSAPLLTNVQGNGPCGPPNYNCTTSRTDIVQTPNTPPFTGSIGAGQVTNDILNPKYDPIIRMSDTSVLNGKSCSSTPSAGDNDEIFDCAWRLDTTQQCATAKVHYVACQEGGADFVAAFLLGPNTTNGQKIQLAANFPKTESGNYPKPAGALSGAHTVPGTYYYEGAVNGDPGIYKAVYSWDGVIGDQTTFQTFKLYDVGANCPGLPNGVNYGETWSGPISVDIKDNILHFTSSNVVGISASNNVTATVNQGSTLVTNISTPATTLWQRLKRLLRFSTSTPVLLPTDGSLNGAAIVLGGVKYVIASNTATTITLTMGYIASSSTVALTIPSGQGTGIYAIAWKSSDNSCSVWNTYTGQVKSTGSFPGNGIIDSGCTQMHIHDAFMFRDGVYSQVSGASTGINCGSTSIFWQIGTSHVVNCTGMTQYNSNPGSLCQGHNTFGYSDEVTISNPHYFKFYPGNANSIIPVSSFNQVVGNCENHFSWRNSVLGDMLPVIGATANNNYTTSATTSTWTNPLMNEVYILFMTGQVKRLWPTYNLGNVCTQSTDKGPFSSYFTAANSIGAVDQGGHVFCFNSDGLGKYGTDANGNYAMIIECGLME